MRLTKSLKRLKVSLLCCAVSGAMRVIASAILYFVIARADRLVAISLLCFVMLSESEASPQSRP